MCLSRNDAPRSDASRKTRSNARSGKIEFYRCTIFAINSYIYECKIVEITNKKELRIPFLRSTPPY